MNKKRVIISPHFDDAVLSAWSRITPNTTIVTVCAGIPDKETVVSSSDKKCGFDSAVTAALTRKEEDIKACNALEVKYVHLDFLDYPYARNKKTAAVETAFASVIEDVEEVYAPIGIGCHPDHLIARDAAIELCMKKGYELFLYADYPYAAEKDKCKERFDRDKIIEGINATLDNEEIVCIKSDDIRKKISAFKFYASQIAVLKSHYSELLDCPGILGTESFWRVIL